MRFTKMQGIGNDYIYVNCFALPLPKDPADLAKNMSDRHFGVGADGLILICPSEKADVRMRMYNADGSEGEMCGNGIRCVAKYAYEHGLAAKETMAVETGRGVLQLQLFVHGGKVQAVTVDMGEPILISKQIPTTWEGPQVLQQPLENDWGEQVEELCVGSGLDPRITCVSMGNPHGILYCQDVAQVPLDVVGRILEHAPVFPRRMNVHFAQVQSPKEVTMRTWERGSGITLACGTGASAVCVAGVLTGNNERKLLAHLPGGDLELHWDEQNNHVFMTGSATEVFSGEWHPSP
jgi:diaminopimelate epimerase